MDVIQDMMEPNAQQVRVKYALVIQFIQIIFSIHRTNMKTSNHDNYHNENSDMLKQPSFHQSTRVLR